MSGRRARWRSRVLRHAPGASARPPIALPAAPTLPPRPRVLVIRPDHLGDALFTGPALARLRAAWPDARITLLVGPWSAPIAERLRGADAVETLDFPWFDRRPSGAPWRPYLRLARAARRLRGRFDAAVVLRDDDGWSAWLAALAGVPVRAGHDHPALAPFLTHTLPAALRPDHTAAANVALACALTGSLPDAIDSATDPLRLTLGAADHAAAAALLGGIASSFGGAAPPRDGPASPLGAMATPRIAGRTAPDRPIAIHPGSGAAIKRWRAGAWGEVIRELTAPGEAVVVTGGEAERGLAAAIEACADRPIIDLTGRTTVGTLAAVFAACRMVLGPDSGPLHLAVAAGTPTVHLFGPASAQRFGPWGNKDRHAVAHAGLPCAPCGRLDWPDPDEHPCVRAIEVAAVLAAARLCGPPARHL